MPKTNTAGPVAGQSDWRDRLVLSVGETAGILGVHCGTVRTAIAAGTIAHVRVGRRILVPVAAIIATFSAPADGVQRGG